MTKLLPIILFFALIASNAPAQDKDKKYFQRLESPFLADTTSTMLFLIRGNDAAKSFFGEHTSNIVVYDFTKDIYRRLFDQDVYVQRTALFPQNEQHPYGTATKRHVNPKWIFYIVKNSDTNSSGRLDERDAAVLFVTNARGENLRALTPNGVNVVGLTFYERLGFALAEIQRDSDGDKSFKYEDKVFYYQKINLDDLSMGNPIETGARP